MSATMSPEAGTTQVDMLPTSLSGSVDVFDAAARLEASGHGISTALRAGYTSTFSYAQALMPLEVHHERVRPTSDVTIHGGWARTVVLISGVAMCLLMLGPGTPPLQLFLAAGATWSVSQVVSAVLWTGIGRGGIAVAARIALSVAAVALLLAAAIGSLLGWAILGWAAWGVVAAVGNSLFAGRRFAQLCAAGALIPLVLYLWDPFVARAVAAGVVAAAVTLALLTIGRLSAQQARIDAGMVKATAQALVQSLALQAGLVGLYLLQPTSFSVIALAGFALAVVLETSLDYVTGLTRSVAARTTSWRRARTGITWIAIAATAAGGLAGGVLCVAVGDILGAGQLSGGTYQAAIVLGVLMTASGLLLRCGSAAGAAVVSATGAALMLMGQVLHHSLLEVATSLLVAAGFCVVTALVAARHVAAPRNW